MKKKFRSPHHPKPSSDLPLKKLAFLFYDFQDTDGQVNRLSESLKRLKKEYHGSASFFVVEPPPDEIPETGELSMQKISRGHTVIPAIDHGFDFVILLNASHLEHDLNFNEFFRDDFRFPDNDMWGELTFRNQLPGSSGGLIFSAEIARYLSQFPANPKATVREDALWYLRRLPLRSLQVSTGLENPYSALPATERGFFAPRGSLKRWYNWNFRDGFSGGRQRTSFSFIKESPMLRPLFIMATLLTLIILPTISYRAGISGDEEKHWLQAGKVYDYFATGGKDTLALNDPKYKLNYYGQSFDLMTYVFIKTFHIKKIYETRHIFNGITGALTIVCAALLARMLLGNLAGLLTLFLMFFSPRFLGHAMNNPLDIPFAFGYMFTLLQMVRFLKRLPEFSVRVAILLVLGIAYTISIRIGGLILVPYLFLFASLYVLYNKWPWPFMSSGYLRFVRKGLVFASDHLGSRLFPEHPSLALCPESTPQKPVHIPENDVEHLGGTPGHVRRKDHLVRQPSLVLHPQKYPDHRAHRDPLLFPGAAVHLLPEEGKSQPVLDLHALFCHALSHCLHHLQRIQRLRRVASRAFHLSPFGRPGGCRDHPDKVPVPCPVDASCGDRPDRRPDDRTGDSYLPEFSPAVYLL